MESNFELQRLSAFLDEALDSSQQLQTQAALRADASLRSELYALRQVSEAVQVHATRHALPERLAERVRHAVVLARAEEARERKTWRLPTVRADWFQPRWAVAVAAVAAVAAWGLKSVLPGFDADERLMEAAVTSHLRATMETRLVDVASDDPGTVTAWLSTRLSISASSLDQRQRAASLLGGRIDSLEGRSTATLVYRLDHHIVDVFVLPMASGDDSIATTSLRGYTVSHWTHGGLRYCVVSDLPGQPLVAFVQALKQGGAS